MGYRHLSIDEREVILKMRENDKTLEDIGTKLGRSPSTISRELQRNVSSTGEYKAHLAQKYYQQRREQSKSPYRLEHKPLRSYVQTKLKQYWSPEQICGRMQREYPEDLTMRTCPSTLYQWIRADRMAGGTYYQNLRQGLRKRRKRYGSTETRGQIPDKRRIDQRPKVIEKRSRIGDWESDSVVGCQHKSHMATHVERKSRYAQAAKLASKSAEDYTVTTCSIFANLPSAKVKTFTVDNGKEFANFKEMEKELSAKVYFANPYHSWERGTNENTNGLLRQFFPKGTDFNQIRQKEIDKVIDLLNNRPRKCLNYRTPAEVFWE
jgi:IS30 family transposase